MFLDEIGDMPMEAQTRLLRVLQQGEYSSVGRRTAIKTDVRILAATNRDLRQLIQHGLFREDLYYRLNVVPLAPALQRANAAKIMISCATSSIARKKRACRSNASTLRRSTCLRRYRWPGNVRKLENLIRRMAVLQSGDTITAAALSAELKEPPPRCRPPARRSLAASSSAT